MGLRSRLKRLCTALDFETRLAEADTLAAMRDQLKRVVSIWYCWIIPSPMVQAYKGSR